MRSLKVIHPGVLTLYQDLGRNGFQKYGIPRSGAMDSIALRAANLLLGNSQSEVGLEITLGGLKMVALSSLHVAVTGADLHFTINDESHPSWGSFSLRAGDVVHFKNRKTGLRSYLAVQGGFQAPIYLGSSSVFQRGYLGTPISKDEILETKNTNQKALHAIKIPRKYLPGISEKSPIRVIMGPQADRFAEEGVHQFLHSIYNIKPQSDRMAYRLDGPRIFHRDKADIISEPVMPGSIQVPSEGYPIVLMMDAQVTGGYTKIANVITADMPTLAQAIPGDSVQFDKVGLEEAYQALHEREQILVWLLRNI
jgi:biotin-dependent carboxylase-like uncharacterized protein